MFWFHCGRCGSLFQAEPGEVEGRLCPKCGFDPAPVVQAAPAELLIPPGADPSAESPAHRAKRTGRKRKNSHVMLKLIGGWTLLLAVIVFGARRLWPEGPTENQATTTSPAALKTNEEDVVLLHDGLEKCMATLSGFLSAETMEGRNQFVLSPVTTASRMSRFYTQNPFTAIDPKTLTLTGKSVVHLPESPGIETQWRAVDGSGFDAVFREENGEWHLDWDHFARYGDYPWSLFLAGTGPESGEFRLLARERLAEERKEEESISIVLYAPRSGHPDETGFQSPEFLVSRKTRDGRLLDAAFKLARDGKRVFGSQLKELNPEGMVRVRVKVRRIEEEAGRRFEITGVTACHWFATDDPGVEPLAPEPPEKPAEEKVPAGSTPSGN